MVSPALLGRVCRIPVILRGTQQIQPLSASSPRGMEDLKCRNAICALLLDRLYMKYSSIAAHWSPRDGHISTSACPLSLLLLSSAITPAFYTHFQHIECSQIWRKRINRSRAQALNMSSPMTRRRTSLRWWSLKSASRSSAERFIIASLPYIWGFAYY